ncbi:uncharacterized protein LOC108043813 [Drosophila rhopaloa]|uniref:Uncharacterized protein LOC108043813 n=1 Tax=Drosophila rhopaloa TaxID=1041015 RepID=A0A6P4EYI4_DRORH|nr:uncharacterized protein LOC108043813 [Drosophila rhopaloa]
MKTWYFIWGLYVLINLANSDKRNFRIYFDEFAVKYKVDDIFEKMDCHLVQTKNRSFVNAEMILKKNVADLNVRALMEFWKPNTQKKTKLYDVRLNGCNLLASIYKHQLFSSYVKSFKKHANVILLCPFKANYSYKMVDWFLDEDDLPPFSPVGKFRTLTEYFTQQRLVIRIVAHGEVMIKN